MTFEPVFNVDARSEHQHHIDARQEPPVVNVDNRSEPAVVNVTTPEVVVNVPEQRIAEVRTKVQTVEHTADGRIAAIRTEETVE